MSEQPETPDTLVNEPSINSLIMAVTADPDVKADSLRKMARAVWWAGFNAAKQVDYDRDMALQHAVSRSSEESDVTDVLMEARTYHRFLAGELDEIPALTDKPKRKPRRGESEKEVVKSEAEALLERMGLK